MQLRTGSGAFHGAMASTSHQSATAAFWRDDQIVLDRDGIPHYTGAQPGLMREYRKRVIFAFNTLEGEGDSEEKERRDLLKRQKRFAHKLLNALHGEAWRACQDLMIRPEDLQVVDGYKQIFKALQSIEKVTVVKKTEQFDRFFERGFRKRGQPLDQYLRERRQDWSDLKDLDDQTSMSEDLLSYFILKQCNLSREDRRQILLANSSSYSLAGIEQAMRVSFYDIHEREKVQRPPWDTRSGKSSSKGRRSYGHYVEEKDIASENAESVSNVEVTEYDDAGYWLDEKEDEFEEAAMVQPSEEDGEVSDAGASQDEDVYEAYTVMDRQRKGYKDSRRRLKEVQKQRGFFRNEGKGSSDRQAMIEKEKSRSRCGACHRIGHWAGDAECPKSSNAGPNKTISKSKSKGRGKRPGGKAYLVSEEPLFFTLGELEDDEDAFCSMVKDDELKRKTKEVKMHSEDDDDDWSRISSVAGYSEKEKPKKEPTEETRRMPVITEEAKVTVMKVADIDAIRPKMDGLTVRELQDLCDQWGMKHTGTKAEIVRRLHTFYMGVPVHKAGCSKQFVMLEEEKPEVETVTSPVKKTREKSKEAASSAGIPVPEDGGRSFRIHGKSSVEKPEPKPGIFRSDAVRRDHEQAYFVWTPPDDDSKKMPQTSQPAFQRPPINIGEVLPGVPCRVCRQSLVVRQNRTKGNLFFGCSMFGRTGCRFTFDYEEGLGEARKMATLAK